MPLSWRRRHQLRTRLWSSEFSLTFGLLDQVGRDTASALCCGFLIQCACCARGVLRVCTLVGAAVSKEQLKLLDFMLGDEMALSALGLVGTKRLVCVTNRPSGRHFFSVAPSDPRTRRWVVVAGMCLTMRRWQGLRPTGALMASAPALTLPSMCCNEAESCLYVCAGAFSVTGLRLTCGPTRQCKHVLAVRLAQSLDRYFVKYVDSVEFVHSMAAAP